MNMRRWLWFCLVPLLPACSDDDDDVCGSTPSFVLNNPNPRATGVPFELSVSCIRRFA